MQVDMIEPATLSFEEQLEIQRVMFVLGHIITGELKETPENIEKVRLMESTVPHFEKVLGTEPIKSQQAFDYYFTKYFLPHVPKDKASEIPQT